MSDMIIEVEETPILVEFAPQPGVRQVGIGQIDPKALAEKSAKALDAAMGTIKGIARRVTETVDKISDKPTEVSVEFGIKLDAEAGAYIAKASVEAGFTVTLTWKQKP
jgi:hypothetical protein